MFCKHEWELISETTTKSRVEVLKELGATRLKGVWYPVDRKFIQVFHCKKCGKLKRFVEDI
jgi:hypothetical protein